MEKLELKRYPEDVVSFLRAQAGRFTFAESLMDKAMKLEQEELGNRPQKMKDLYHLKAIILDEVR